MDANAVRTYRSEYNSERPEFHYYYNYFFLKEIYKKHREHVFYSRRLPDQVNIYADDFKGRLVKKVNGKKCPRLLSLCQTYR